MPARYHVCNNAARNLLNLAASGSERVNACGGMVRPGPAGHIPVKQEPGTRKRDKTGTAAPQGTAAARARPIERSVATVQIR